MKLPCTAAALATAAMLAAPAQAADQPLRVLMMDADGGAATLFVTPEGKSMLIDTGWPHGMPQGRPARDGTPAPPPPAATVDRVLAGMQRLGLKKIDYVLITHYHVDHVGGVHDIMARVPVGAFIDHGPNREELAPQQAASPSPNHPAVLYPKYEAAIAGHERRVVKAGDKIQLGSLTLDFVASDGGLITEPLPGAGGATALCETPDKAKSTDENSRSIGFVATYGRARILDLADLTWNEEKQLVCPVNKLGAVDVLLVSHHGSELSNSPPLLDAASPTVALVANGARKGGDKSVFEALKATASKPAIWNQHLATRDSEANPDPKYIANMSVQPDGAYELHTLVWPNGAVQVVNTRNGYTESYPAP